MAALRFAPSNHGNGYLRSLRIRSYLGKQMRFTENELMELLTILWTGGEAKGCTDLFPLKWFENDSVADRCATHWVILRNGASVGMARCSISVTKNIARLDYGATPATTQFNNNNLMQIGEMKIIFQKTDRKIVSKVLWRSAQDEGFQIAPTKANITSVNEIEVTEGAAKLAVHIILERNRALAAKKKAFAFDLSCEVCSFKFSDAYHELGDGFCEVHHKKHLAHGPRTTTLDDLAILCSNCHRMIHRTIPMMSVEKFKLKYLPNGRIAKVVSAR